MPKITASAPVLLVRDVVASANYYRDALGFSYDRFYGEPPSFCICHRDGHSLMLAQVEEASQIQPFWKFRDRTCNAYFWVDDADALYEQMKAAGARMDYGPCTQPYGVREFGIQDLDEHDISFGQVLPE
jgi:catechol 2,3-dioxygenase-like lactoylglutathione lyase family enzyme